MTKDEKQPWLHEGQSVADVGQGKFEGVVKC